MLARFFSWFGSLTSSATGGRLQKPGAESAFDIFGRLEQSDLHTLTPDTYERGLKQAGTWNPSLSWDEVEQTANTASTMEEIATRTTQSVKHQKRLMKAINTTYANQAELKLAAQQEILKMAGTDAKFNQGSRNYRMERHTLRARMTDKLNALGGGDASK